MEIVPETAPRGSYSRKAGRSRPSSSVPLAARREPDAGGVRAEDRPQPRLGRGEQLAERLDAERVQARLGHRADAGQLAHRQRRERGGLGARAHQQHAPGLGEPARDLGHRLADRDASARRQPELAIDRIGHLAHHAQDRRIVVGVDRAPIHPLAAAEVDVVLVDAGGDDDRAVALDDLSRAIGVIGVLVAVPGHEDRVGGRALGGLSDRHPRAHAERAHLVARRRHDAAAAAAPTDDDRPPAQAGIEQALDGHEERVEIDAAQPRSQHRTPRSSY
ncbi:MAG TPA: hypothetical protein VLM79_38185 [Kofleriaceae bacterium]|nr:hypothetical protein [Kofleriaceae bacterium]